MSTWPTESPTWSLESIKLLQESSTNQVPVTNLKEIIHKSKQFPIKFPVTTILTQNLQANVDKQILQRNVESVYPIVHEYTLKLCVEFLIFKRAYGSEIEKKFYKNLTISDLIQRLLSNRAVSFVGPSDHYLLLDGENETGNWTSIGTSSEKDPLVLNKYLSYDEIKLSALLSVSSYSYFINDGNRFNNGVVEKHRSNIEPEGIIIGLIGTRFERPSSMEYEEIIVSKSQNTLEKGYGNSENPSLHKVFAAVYEDKSFTYSEVKDSNNERFVQLGDNLIFDNVAYSKRLALSFDTLLLEANHRAKYRNKMAYIHVVGIGLGVWKISSHQTQIFVNTFGERIRFLGTKLNNVSHVHFAYISNSVHCIGHKNGDLLRIEGHPCEGIKILIAKREPFTKLSTGELVANKEDKLLVVSYAWDGNAQPGNEFWGGALCSTGDSAAAASTQISELHNPHINPLVCGANLHVATVSGSVLPLSTYVQNLNAD